MQIEFVLPMSAFDTPAVEAAFEHFIAKCQAEVSAGNRDNYVGYERRLRRLLKTLKKAELDAVERAMGDDEECSNATEPRSAGPGFCCVASGDRWRERSHRLAPKLSCVG